MFSFTRKRNAKAVLARRSAEEAKKAASKSGIKSRTVSHSRWIHTDDLKRGMYVAELNVPWEDTDFMFQGFVIDSNLLLRQVRQTSTHALVKTQKVTRLSNKHARQVCTH